MTPGLWLDDVHFGWTHEVLSSVSVHLTPGWTGVSGANGGGKSTLLALIAGRLRPDDGVVRRVGVGSVADVAQLDPIELPADVLTLADDPAGGAWRARLGVEGADPRRWGSLSPGERRRWRIAAALASEPDLLLLDEPTNHLDAEVVGVIVQALRAYRGIGVVVSHDRSLLDALTERTLRVVGGRVQDWPGPYHLAKSWWEAEEAERMAERGAAKSALAAATRQVAQKRDERASADRMRSRSARAERWSGSDARSMANTNLASWAEARAGRSVGVARRAQDRAAEALDALGPVEDLGRPLHLHASPLRRPVVASFRGPLVVGGRTLLTADVQLGRHDRVALTGRNGAGKSSLLAALAGSLSSWDGVMWLPQVLRAEEIEADARAIAALPSDARGRVGQLLAALGVAPARIAGRASLSPGEARKQRLALGLGGAYGALLLDEPSNDLDLPTVERLGAALAGWEGAMVLISHDAALAASCTEIVWEIGAGEVNVSRR